jgi:hypothetical protein
MLSKRCDDRYSEFRRLFFRLYAAPTRVSAASAYRCAVSACRASGSAGRVPTLNRVRAWLREPVVRMQVREMRALV